MKYSGNETILNLFFLITNKQFFPSYSNTFMNYGCARKNLNVTQSAIINYI